MQKSYEKVQLVKTSSIFLLICELLIIVIFCQMKIFQYKKIAGVVEKENIVLFVISKKDRDLIYKNSNLYFLDKKKKYKIQKDEGVLFKKNKEDYYGIVLKFDFPNKYTANDSIEIVLKKNKCSVFRLLKNIWEGDNY